MTSGGPTSGSAPSGSSHCSPPTANRSCRSPSPSSRPSPPSSPASVPSATSSVSSSRPRPVPVAGTSRNARREAERLRRLGLEQQPRRNAKTVSGMPDWDRRRFLIGSAGVAVGAVVAGTLGRSLTTSRASAAPAADTSIPKPAETVPPLTPDESLNVPGITPIVIPNDEFYRIDTALLPVRLDASTWTLTVKGMVDHVVTLNYKQITTLPLFEQYVTIQCVVELRRGRPRRQRQVDRRQPPRRARHGRRPAGGDPDRRAVRRRVHGRLPDRVGDGPGREPDDRPRS